METVTIATESRTYPVYVGSGIVNQLPTFLMENCRSITKILIITDENIARHYLQRVVDILKNQFDVISYVIPAGERAKSFQIYYECQSFALSNGLDRSSLLVAFGGGVVGDLGGFVAATYMRGIPFVQVPTTLLAHDSAVGGKVAINHELGKNMIGAFYQPNAVVFDIDFLETLPPEELRSGFAEVIKHGLIWDQDFYRWLRSNINSLDDLKGKKLQHVIQKGVSIKAEVVSRDEHENGLRAILNFGHTLGHAIEAEAGYGQVSHGDGVVIGMIFALKISRGVLNCSVNIGDFISWLSNFHFPTSIPHGIIHERLVERMKRDKKAKTGKVNMVLLKEIADVEVREIDDKQLYIWLEDM